MRPWKSILVLCLLLVAMVSHVAMAGWSVAPKSVMADMQGTRLGGQLYGDARLTRLESYLSKRNVQLVRNADDLLDARGANGLFRARADGTGELLLRSNATRYEVLHELKHFRDFRRLGFDQYKALGRVGREQSVFDVLSGPRRWSILTQAEKDHAFMYILRLGGNPIGKTP